MTRLTEVLILKNILIYMIQIDFIPQSTLCVPFEILRNMKQYWKIS